MCVDEFTESCNFVIVTRSQAQRPGRAQPQRPEIRAAGSGHMPDHLSTIEDHQAGKIILCPPLCTSTSLSTPFTRSLEVVMVVEAWRQRGHNEGTSLREDAGYDEKC
jgi:hypothetical protein